MLSRRRRAQFALRTLLATSSTVLAAACGLSVTGGEGSPQNPPPTPEASLPGKGEGGTDVPDATGTDAGDSGDGGSCASNRGPAMVAVGNLADGGFCVDSTEVTVAQYKLFVDAVKSSQWSGDAGCTIVDVVARDDAGNGPGDFPITSVPWCEARAFCVWAGKHMCTGSPNGEWPRACTANGTRLLPYGNATQPGRCNVASTGLEAVRTRSGMCSGSDGIFDMVGNAAEWVDNCSGASCDGRGGSFLAESTCASVNQTTASSWAPSVGFRCCR
jgi:formylglycine-generating enzyme